jgi:D-serine dehydratase
MDSLKKTEDIFIEPSACASFAALMKSDKLNQYIKCNGLESVAHNAIHIAWATGGSMVPEYMIEEYLSKVSK